jgi:hypothetical protein
MTTPRKVLLLCIWIAYAAAVGWLTGPFVDFRQAFFGLSVLNGLTFLIAITALLRK